MSKAINAVDVRKVAVFYAHVASNFGDLAINRGQVALLGAAFPMANLHSVTLNSGNADYLPLAAHELRDNRVTWSHYRTSFRSALTYSTRPAQFLEDCEAMDADLVVLSSGEQLFSYENQKNNRAIYWRSLPALAAKAAGKLCVLLPSTLGPFEHPDVAKLVASLLGILDGAAVREPSSARLVRAHLDGLDIPVLLDPAFMMSAQHAPSARPSGRLGRLGIAMRSELSGIRIPADERRANTEPSGATTHTSSAAYRFTRALCERHLRSKPDNSIRLYVQTEADRGLADAVQVSLTAQGLRNEVTVSRPASLDDYIADLSGLDGLVAARFHAVVLGLLAGIPPVGVYFDVHGHKMPGLFELLQRSDHCFNLSQSVGGDDREDYVLDAVTSMSSDLPELQDHLEGMRRETAAWLGAIANRGIEASRLISATEAFGDVAASLVAIGYEEHEARKIQTLKNSHSVVADEAKAEIERLKKRIAEADAAAREANAELEQTRARLRDAERDAASFRSQLHVIRSSILYQLAEETLRVVRLRRGFLSLPMRWLGVIKDVRELRRLGENGLTTKLHEARESTGKPRLGSLLVKTSDEIIAEIRSAGPDRRKAATELLAASEWLFDQRRYEEASDLALAASELDGSERSYRVRFWASQKAGRLEDACRAVDELESFLGRRIRSVQRQRLERLKSQPAYQLKLRALVPDKADREFAGTPGRVCYVLHNSLPHSSGGYATRAHGLATHLRRLGLDVVGITRPGYPFDVNKKLIKADVPGTEIVDGVPYVRNPAPSRTRYPLREFVPLASDVMVEQFRRLEPEVVVAASNYMCALPALIACRRLGLEFIYEVRGFWEVTRWSRDPSFIHDPAYLIQEVMEAFVCQEADRVVTLTGAMKNELGRRGVQTEKISLVPNACDPDRLNPKPRDPDLARLLRIPPDMPVVGYVGTFVDYEGLDDLAEACGLLREEGIEFRLLLVGNEDVSGDGRGPITERIAKTAAASGLSDWLIMPGRVPHDEVPSYYSLIDIAAFPRKPWPVCEMVSPMKPLEAMAMAKTVVVSSVAALAEMVDHGRYGLIFAKGDVQALARELKRAVLQPDLRNQLGESGRVYASTVRTWSRSAELFADVIGISVPREELQR